MGRLTPDQLRELWRRAAAATLTKDARVQWFGQAVMDAMEGRLPPERAALSALRLPAAIAHPLLRAGYQWVDQIEGMDTKELMRVNNVGLNRAIQIRLAIERWRSGG